MLHMLNRPNPKQAENLQQKLEFVEAWFDGNIDKVAKMMDGKGFSANTKDLHGNTALMEAALMGRYKIWKLLLNENTVRIYAFVLSSSFYTYSRLSIFIHISDNTYNNCRN